MLRHYINMSCQDDEPDAGARQLLGGKPGPKPPPKSRAGGGTSPLHLASCRGHVGVVHELLIAGADATRGDQFGYSALHLAAKHGFPDVITELLSFSSVDVDLLDESGETALHTAARYAKTMCMSRLLEHGGNLNILSRSGRRAMDVVGQPQDKHNLQSLPHSATQLAGTGVSRRSHKFNTNMPPAQLPRDKCTEERIRRLLTVAAGGKKSGWMWPEGVLRDPSIAPSPPPPPAAAAAAKDDDGAAAGGGGAAAAAAAVDENDDDTWDPIPEDSSDSDTDIDTAEGAADDAAGARVTISPRGYENGEPAATATAERSALTAPSHKDEARGNGWGCAPRLAEKTPRTVTQNACATVGEGVVAESTDRDVAPAAEIPASGVGSSSSLGVVPDRVAPAVAASSCATGDAAGADAAAGGATAAVAVGDVDGGAKGAVGNGDIEDMGVTYDKIDAPVGKGDGGNDGAGSSGEISAAGGVGAGVVNGSLCGCGATTGGAEVGGLPGAGAGAGAGAVSKTLPSPLARLNIRQMMRGGRQERNADVFKAINRYTYTSPSKPGLAPRAR